MTHDATPPPPVPERVHRRRVDLSRLPIGLRAVLVLTVVLCVVSLAWWQGRDEAVPTWITDWLVPALGWAWLALAAVALVSWWRRRRAHRRAPADQGDKP